MMADIYSKGSIIQPRQLRRLNGKRVVFMSGEEGKIAFPYIIIKRKKDYQPVNIMNRQVFKEIKQIRNGRVTLAERVNSSSPLYSTGQGLSKKKTQTSYWRKKDES
ncbi:hypothetical protein Tempeh6L_11855 [Lactococcus lactis subsp. lactis]